MEWEAIVLSALVGALSGGVGWLATRKMTGPNSERAKFICMGAVVFGAAAGNVVVAPIAKDWKTRRELQSLAMDLYGNEEMATLNTKTLMAIIKDPRFDKRIRGLRAGAATNPGTRLGGTQTGVADLVAAGMTRIEGPDLLAIFDVKRALAEKSELLCASFWTGRFSPAALAALNDGLRGLPREHQTTWITVSGRALAAEIASAGASSPVPSDDAMSVAMRALTATLAPEQQQALESAGSGTPGEETACGAFRALAAGMRGIPAEQQVAIMRATSGTPAQTAK